MSYYAGQMPPVQQQAPPATKQQMDEYDKEKRKNNALIIALVIIVILLVAAIIAIFVLLYASNVLTDVAGGTGATSSTDNTITLKFDITRTDISYSAESYGSSSLNAYQSLVNLICDNVDTIGTGIAYTVSTSSCTATTMSAATTNDPTGVKVEGFTVAVDIGSTAKDTGFTTMSEALIAGITGNYAIDAASIEQVTA